MSYVRTELSKEDNEILEELYKELEGISITKSYRKMPGFNHHGERTGTSDQRDARQACFGMVKYHQRLKESGVSIKYPHIMPLLKKFMDSHNPGFQFTNVYVNKNAVCKKHVDSKNVGVTLLIGFGDYTGGDTVLHINNEPVKCNINGSSLIFDGSVIQHESEPFEGTRYSLVFFNTSFNLGKEVQH
jgi:hypothetical protein